MNLDDAQRKQVGGWIAEGLKLSDIQKRLADELGLRLTYMEVRLLVDDLKLTPKDPEPTPTPELSGAQPGKGAAIDGEAQLLPEDDARAPGGGGVSVKVDQLARPGAIVSGQVTFTDGKSAEWYLDQMGRIGLAPKEAGYKPAASDVQIFQAELQRQLAKMGF